MRGPMRPSSVSPVPPCRPHSAFNTGLVPVPGPRPVLGYSWLCAAGAGEGGFGRRFALPSGRGKRVRIVSFQTVSDLRTLPGYGPTGPFRVSEGVFATNDAKSVTGRMKEDIRENTNLIEKNETEIQRNQMKVGAIDQVLVEVDQDRLQRMGADLPEAIAKVGGITIDLNVATEANRKIEILIDLPEARYGWLLGAAAPADGTDGNGKDTGNGTGKAPSGNAAATVNATTPEAGVSGPRFASGNIYDAGAGAAGRAASLSGLEALRTTCRDAAQAERLDARLRGLHPDQRKHGLAASLAPALAA